MRLPLFLSILTGIAGCTYSQNTVNMTLSPIMVSEEQSMNLTAKDVFEKLAELLEEPAPRGAVVLEPIIDYPAVPDMPDLPPVPSFTDDELSDPHVVERKLVEHIKVVRSRMHTVHAEMEAFEHKYRRVTEQHQRHLDRQQGLQ